MGECEDGIQGGLKEGILSGFANYGQARIFVYIEGEYQDDGIG